MALTGNEKVRGQSPVQDPDGRLIVVGPDGVPIGGGGGGSDPLSDGTDTGALPSKTLWVAGADGTVLRGIRVDSSGRLRTVIEGTPAVSVSNFPATQPVSGTVSVGNFPATQPVSGPLTDTQLRASVVPVSVSNFPGTQPVSGTVTSNQGTPNSAANKWPVSVTDGTNTAQVLNSAPGADTGQSAVAVRVVSQLGAGSGGGGGGTSQADKSAFTEGTTVLTPIGGVLNEAISADPTEDQAAAARITPKRAVHTNLRNNAGTEIATSGNPIRTDPTGTTTQPVSGTVTANGPLTDTQLRASAVPVTGAFFQATQPVSLSAVPTVTEKQDQPAGTTTTWTSATALNTALTNNSVAGYGTANVSIQVPSTVTGGVITLEVSDDGTVWYQAGSVRVDNGSQENVVTLALTPGQVLNRMYSVSVDAMTNIRARLSTVIAGAGNVVVRITLVAGGIEPFVATRSRKVATYWAPFRVATRPYHLDKTFTANTRVQFATIHHAAAAVKTVKLRRVRVIIHALVVSAAELNLDLVRITTAPATGNPAITPGSSDSSDAAAEATCLALPTTAGTEGAIIESRYMSYGITGSTTIAPPPIFAAYELLEPGLGDDETKLPTIRAGVLEGWAVTIDATAAVRLLARVEVQFTEEAP